ncbi:MAG: major capsid protein P2 [Coriobacteriia bacterium]
MLLKNPAFLNVVQNGVAAVRIPRGDVVNTILLVGSGTAIDLRTMITRVVVRLNEKIIYDLTGAQINTINAYRGLPSTAGYLRIDFIEPTAINYGTQMLGGIDTSRGVASLDVEVTLTGAPADVTLSSYRDVSPAQPKEVNDPGLFLAMIPITLPITAAGKFSFTPPFGPARAHRVKRLHFFGSAITALGIKKDSLHVFENIPVAVNDHYNSEFGFVPQANHKVVDFYVKGDGIENLFLGNAKGLEYEVETSGAGNVIQISEVITALNWI